MAVRFDASDLLEGLMKAESKTQVAIKMYATEGAKKMQNYAKQHRPWTDRTGQARQRLTGWVETLSNRTRIYIGHGVDYGIYLELSHEKKYAILQPTVNATGPEILQGYKRLIGHFK